MTEKAKGITGLISAVQIAQIRLIEATATSQSPFAAKFSAVTLQVSHTASVKKRDNRRFLVSVTIDTKAFLPVSETSSAQEDVAKNETILSILATFELQYSYSEDIEATDKDFEQFAKTNGVFNAWPYCREFVQNTVSRMGLPPLVLPLIRIPAIPSEHTSQEVPKLASS